ncbi:DUF5995 family protein [Zobellia roscoffensis]|uniref:DUF5995 family protein n=1 Tax=Zobellia roscoffensis TaxID=2779508 RepID=UPI0037448D80
MAVNFDVAKNCGDQHTRSPTISKSWAFAFKNKNEPLTILQDILMGINTPINLDFGVSC